MATSDLRHHRHSSTYTPFITVGVLLVVHLICGNIPPQAFGQEQNRSEFKTHHIESTHDGHKQPVRFYNPGPVREDVPLFVLLHSWSHNYQQDLRGLHDIVERCRKRNWALIMPNYRGPNKRPEACASDAAVQDVLDAVEYAKRTVSVDEDRVYLFGGSGGGHMSLMMAAKAPEVWAAVSAWVPIVDLTAWYHQSKRIGRDYWRDLEAVCGGPPDRSDKINSCYRQRSPLFVLDQAANVKIHINAGIHDGHKGSVPISHSLRAFNKLAVANRQPGARVPPEAMRVMTQEQTIPKNLRWQGAQPKVRTNPILFSREAGPVRLTIFDGGHETDLRAAFSWLARLAK